MWYCSGELTFGQGDDGDEDAEEEVESARVSAGLEDVGCDLVKDVIAEHEKSHHGGDRVEEELRPVRLGPGARGRLLTEKLKVILRARSYLYGWRISR
jgi:hypothetical protein